MRNMKSSCVTASSAKPKHLAMLEEETKDQSQCTITPCNPTPKNPINSREKINPCSLKNFNSLLRYLFLNSLDKNL